MKRDTFILKLLAFHFITALRTYAYLCNVAFENLWMSLVHRPRGHIGSPILSVSRTMDTSIVETLRIYEHLNERAVQKP